jgi:glycosyltransferase involved in cell wall biosynthesis
LDEPFRLRVSPAERPGPIRILFFARPGMRRRGFELGLDALALVKTRHPDVRVELFGASAAELGTVPFEHANLGVVEPERLAEAMNAAHVSVSLSLTNISNVPFEAMACGCAVVEADVPTTRAMVSPGENCLLAEPEPEALARTIGRLVEEPELRGRLATRAAHDLKGRTWEQTTRQFEQVLLDACFARLEPARLASDRAEDVAVR